MSKVQLQGNVSGTGVFTIASPNSNTDRTLTLPDNTGTLLTQNSQPSFASTIGVGGATPSTSGAGITFPATQSASSNANTLDDYEEGTWTPNLIFGSASTGMTFSERVGNYVKVGKWVTITFNIALSAKGSSTGQALVTGMPFVNYTNLQLSAGILIGERGMSGFNQTNAYFLMWNDGNLYLRYNGSADYQSFSDANFTNGSCIYGVVTYQTSN